VHAAEQILSWESPDDAVNATKAFLRKVHLNEAHASRYRLLALELIRRAEDKKVRPQPASSPSAGLAEKIEAARQAYLMSLGPKTEE
jgi:hypothetical protein